jgi:hypothetical protein
VIGIPSYDRPDIYTVVFQDGSISEYSDTNNILEACPVSSNTSPCSILPNWIQDDANATLFLFDMTKPRHGKLKRDHNNNWIFCPGVNHDISQGIKLQDLSANCQMLMETGQRFRGHTKFRRVYIARNQAQLRDSVLRHVSVHGLASLIAPPSLKHHNTMLPTDKTIWDAAYDEEFDGLASLPTWQVVNEDQFKHLSKGIKALLPWQLLQSSMMHIIVQNARNIESWC